MSNTPSPHQTHDSIADAGALGVDSSSVDSRVLTEVAKALSGLRYGSVVITVHDGKATQIEAKKKIRLN